MSTSPFTIHSRTQTDLISQVRCLAATLPTSNCSSNNFSCLCADENFMTAAGACNAANCSVLDMLQSTNETYAACGVPVRDQSATLMGVVVSIGSLALLMVVMRLLDRAISAQAKLGWDDLLIGLSGVCNDFFTLVCVRKYADQCRPVDLVNRNECACRRSRSFGFRKGHMGHSTSQDHH